MPPSVPHRARPAGTAHGLGPETPDVVPGDPLGGDHVALDLVGSLTEDHQRRIAEVALDVELLGVAIAAVYPHGVQGDLHGGLRREELGHAGLQVRPDTAIEPLRGVRGQQPGRLHPGRHVGDEIADRLVLPDRLAERLALLGVTGRIRERGLGHPHRPRGHLDPADLQPPHHLLPSHARLAAEHRAGRHPHPVEDQLTGLHTAVTELGDLLRDGQPVARLDQQDAHAPVRGLRIPVGPAQQADQARVPGVGDPGLASPDLVLAPDGGGVGPHRLQVAAATGLGERHRGPESTVGHPVEMRRPLLLGAVGGDQVGDHRVPADRAGEAHPAARELLGDPGEAGRADRAPAVLLGDEEAEEAELLHLLDEVLGVPVGVLELTDPRADLVVHEVGDDGHELLLVRGQRGHCAPPGREFTDPAHLMGAAEPGAPSREPKVRPRQESRVIRSRTVAGEAGAPMTDAFEAKRRNILEGASEVFVRRGYAAGTTKEIAAEVGLSQPTIYHYVGAKADLLREIAIHVTEEMTAALSTGLQRSEDPAERLRGVIEEFTAAVGRDRRSFAVFWQELHSLPSDLREEIARAERDYIRQIAEVISALQQTGDMPPGPTVVLARAVLSMPSWMYQWYDPDGPMTAAEIADVYCSLLRL